MTRLRFQFSFRTPVAIVAIAAILVAVAFAVFREALRQPNPTGPATTMTPSSPTIDATDKASLQLSWKQVTAGMNQPQQDQFMADCLTLTVTSRPDGLSILQEHNRAGEDVFQDPKVMKRLHGL